MRVSAQPRTRAGRLVGGGLVARCLTPLLPRHPNVLFCAAGVADGGCTSMEAFAREQQLVDDCIRLCARGRLLLVYFSSASRVPAHYGEAVTEQVTTGPATPYGAHKRRMETTIQAASIRFLIVRLANLVGERQGPQQLVPALARQIRDGCVDVWRGAHRDILDARDAMTMVDRLLAHRVANEIVNVASGHAVPVEALVGHLCLRINPAARRRYLDRPDTHSVCIAKLHALVGDLHEFVLDAGYYRRVLDRYYREPPI